VRAAVLIPVKGFADAKVRLAPALDPQARADLARTMASRVVAAAGSLPVHVVCDDPEVAAWATEVGAQVVWAPGMGLNGAVTFGFDQLAGRGVDHVVVAHADLPLALDLTWLHHFAGVTLVPDRHGDGTNVACIPVGSGFRFAYGPGSFARHVDEARRVGLALRVSRRADLAWDVDIPADLDYCAV
jgi:2-phospho-L-lactate guanylyltransferase